MGRAKLSMELIPKEKTRNTTYQKRKLGIIKKANEFTILCDVDTVVIIYPPNSEKPEIWPENPEKIKKTIACYKAKKGESGKRSYDLNDFFEDRKKKIEDELVKVRKKNMEAKYSTWFDDLNVLTESQLRQFAMRLENRENVVRGHLELRKNSFGHAWGYAGDVGMGMFVPVYDSSSQCQWGLGGYNNQLGGQVSMNLMQEYARLEQESQAQYLQYQVQGGSEFMMGDHNLGRFGYE